MQVRALLIFLSRDQGLSSRILAEMLGISAPYASLLLSGKRSVPDALAAQIRAQATTSPGYDAFSQAMSQGERRLRRPFSAAEQAALASTWPDLSAVLSQLGASPHIQDQAQATTPGEDSQSQPHRADQFEISTALSSLQSLSQILDEEPDLPAPQRQHFIASIKQQAQNLTTMLATPSRHSNILSSTGRDAPPEPAPQQQPDRFVDQVFARQGYYFEALEAEADLAVRRTRRHGPLGTFSLISRLEQDYDLAIAWEEGGGMQPSSLLQQPPSVAQGTISLDPSLGEAQLRFRLAQFLIAREADRLIMGIITQAAPPDPVCQSQLKKALIAYTAAAMFMPYDAFLHAAETHRYDLDWLSRHFACTYEQVCHRILALRKPGASGVPFGLLRVSPAGQTVTRVSLPGLPMPDRFAACPLWAAYAAFRHTGETLTQLAEFPDGERFVFVGRMNEGPRAHFGGSRRLTSLMLACNWAYADRLIYADGHDPQRPSSMTAVGHACITCPRPDCRSRIRPFQGD